LTVEIVELLNCIVLRTLQQTSIATVATRPGIPQLHIMRPGKKKSQKKIDKVGDQLSDPGVCGVTCRVAGHGVFFVPGMLIHQYIGDSTQQIPSAGWSFPILAAAAFVRALRVRLTE
jgi:hypothetical protein